MKKNTTRSKKTRGTPILSRPAICWFIYVQITLSISAEHLINAQKYSEMISNNAQKKSKILNFGISYIILFQNFSNALQCSEMLKNTQLRLEEQ